MKTVTSTEELAAVRSRRAKHDAELAALKQQRAAAARSENRKDLTRLTPEINVLHQLIEQTVEDEERLKPLVAKEKQDAIDATYDAERHAIVDDKLATVPDAAGIDELGAEYIRRVAAQVSKAAPLGPRVVEVNDRLCANMSETNRHSANHAGRVAAAGTDRAMAHAIAVFISDLIDACGSPEGIDDLVSVSVSSLAKDQTFEKATRDEAAYLARLLRV